MTAAVMDVQPKVVSHPAGGQIDELHGFRAIAVWMVLLGHLAVGWKLPDEALSWMPRLLWEFVSHGWLGVDLFFVLSGLLISGILVDSREHPKFFRNFYGRRALRILPLYLTCILVMYLCYGGTYFLLALLFMANFAEGFGVATPHGPGVFWSLAVEEHFYFIWPLIVRFLGRNAMFVLAILVVVGTPVLRWYAQSQGFIGTYEFSFYRFDGMALGACLAVWMRSPFYTRKGAVILAAGLLISIAVVTAITIPYGVFGTGSPMGVALRSTQAQFMFAAGIVIALAWRNTLLTAPLRSGFAVYTARLSFCIYMVHLAVGDLYYWCLRRWGIDQLELWGPVGALAMRSVVIVAVTFAIAALSERYLESPFMKLRNRFV
jgi:peptidoglycan/LPS O-acetylase OafA/YrhL